MIKRSSEEVSDLSDVYIDKEQEIRSVFIITLRAANKVAKPT